MLGSLGFLLFLLLPLDPVEGECVCYSALIVGAFVNQVLLRCIQN